MHTHTHFSLHFVSFLNHLHTLFLKIFYLFLFREGEGEIEGKKHQCVVASRTPPTGYQACNLGTCPDWEWNQRSFASQSNTQSTDPHQPGLHTLNMQFSRYIYILPFNIFCVAGVSCPGSKG